VAVVGWREATFAGIGGKEEDVPIPAIRLTTIDRLKSTGETEPRESDVGKTVRARLTPEPLIS
jgi:hypothetical protein